MYYCSCFHLRGDVNRHNLRVSGSENPHNTIGRARRTTRLAFVCGVEKENVLGKFSFLSQLFVYLNFISRHWQCLKTCRVKKACFAELWDVVPHIWTMQEHMSETVVFGSYGPSLNLEQLMKTAMLYCSRDIRIDFQSECGQISWATG